MSSFKKNQDRNTVKPSRGSILGPVDIGLNNFSLVLIIPSFYQSLQLLLAYVSAIRYEGPEVDRAMAEHDAKSLFKAGEKKLGTDEKTFIRIFSERSRAHLAFVASAYHNMYGNSLKKVKLLP